jgi:hypothetical protein
MGPAKAGAALSERLAQVNNEPRKRIGELTFLKLKTKARRRRAGRYFAGGARDQL